MSNFRSGVTCPKPCRWYVDLAFRFVHKWNNAEVLTANRRFLAPLVIALPQEQAVRAGEAARVQAGRATVHFVVDTGAQTTVISRVLADWLGLSLELSRHRIRRVDGRPLPTLQTQLRVCIGQDWMDLPCLVADVPAQTPSLLGMEGLLEKHMFCIASNELHLFRRDRQC